MIASSAVFVTRSYGVVSSGSALYHCLCGNACVFGHCSSPLAIELFFGGSSARASFVVSIAANPYRDRHHVRYRRLHYGSLQMTLLCLRAAVLSPPLRQSSRARAQLHRSRLHLLQDKTRNAPWHYPRTPCCIAFSRASSEVRYA